jgi:hypothetical protein
VRQLCRRNNGRLSHAHAPAPWRCSSMQL